MNSHAIGAVFRRNFLSYFNNLTGYVFICLFVMLASCAAIWPYEFFNANLDNLDQLNRYLPYILLFFIPAITMSSWADERRQGTDELLLTLPASDVDVVLGKFFAGVAVYTVALLFSAICLLLVLRSLGSPDLFLFAANYFGYWLMGVAMIATGMVASFLTGNLTVAYILGVVFNVPLVFADWADAITGSPEWSQAIKHWGLPEQFRDFGRGMIRFSGVLYFCLVALVMLYLCLVLIGRRHWMGGRDGRSMLGHYLVRFLCLVVAAVSLVLVIGTFDFRKDVTAEQVSSLSPDTIKLLRELDTKNRPIKIDAYVSPTVPENYIQTRYDLLNDLREFQQLSGGRIQVHVVNTEPSTDEAINAEKQFGIRAQSVRGSSRGTVHDEQIFLGAAVQCGLQKVVVPFFDRGVPTEYELIRSITTVSQAKRKRLGVVMTDAQMFGGFEMQGMQPRPLPKWQIVDELEKQYEVVQVDPSKPIEKFDVLLAVQPSTLSQPQMFNLIQAVRFGQPTAIFEDPAPVAGEGVVGTTEPKQQQNPMMGGGSNAPKGDINELWNLLGVKYVSSERNSPLGEMPASDSAVWQGWCPYPKLFGMMRDLPREYVFVGRSEPGGKMPFNDESPITAGLQEMWFPFPGGLQKLNTSKMKFVELMTTGDLSGAVPWDELKTVSDPRDRVSLEDRNTTHENYCLAAHISGAVKGEAPAAASKADVGKPQSAVAEAEKRRAAEATHMVNVVLVPDIDLLSDAVFQMHNSGTEEEIGAHFDNVAFVLNALDILAGDTRFVAIRSREPSHRTLVKMENLVNEYRKQTDDEEHEAADKENAEIQKATHELQDFEAKVRDLEKQAQALQNEGKDIPSELQEELLSASINQMHEEDRVQKRIVEIKRAETRKAEELDSKMHSNIRDDQNIYKILAVAIPPILPFIVGVFVFFSRRAQEREGVSKSRLR